MTSSNSSVTSACSSISAALNILSSKQRTLFINNSSFRSLLSRLLRALKRRPQRACNYDSTTNQTPSTRKYTPNRPIKQERKQDLSIQHTRRLTTLIHLQTRRQ